jgi:hypothetical protein
MLGVRKFLKLTAMDRFREVRHLVKKLYLIANNKTLFHLFRIRLIVYLYTTMAFPENNIGECFINTESNEKAYGAFTVSAYFWQPLFVVSDWL